MRGAVIIPTYEERQTILSLIQEIWTNVPAVDVVVVDDNSPDGTGDLVEQAVDASSERLFLIRRPAKLGLGRAYVEGFQWALAHGYDFVIQMDADFSHQPSHLPRMIDTLREADLVIGSRFVNGISVVNWDFKRLVLSKLATAYVNTVTGLGLADTTGGFKAWRRSALECIDFDRIISRGNLFQVETNYIAHRARLRIVEMPIIFYQRTHGHSKMSFRIMLEALVGVLRLRFHVRRQVRQTRTATNHSQAAGAA